MLFRHPIPSSRELNALYSNSWAAPEEHIEETGDTDLTLASTYARSLLRSLKLRDFSGLRILDFGAGQGGMVQAMSELGADAWAIEPHGYAHLMSQGLQVFRSLDDLPPGLTFHGATAIEVIEHLSSPWIALDQLGSRLVRQGWLFISTPNARGMNARIHRSAWREAAKPGHIFLFSGRSVESVLASCGYNYRRLRWFVDYSSPLIRRVLIHSLQALHLDGVLRYLAWRDEEH